MRTITAIFFFMIVFASCTTPRYSYSPNAHNVPLLTKKGDSKVAVNYSTNGVMSRTDDNSTRYDKNTSNGFDLQGAYAITNNIAVQTNYFYRTEKSNISSGDNIFATSKVRYKRSLFELGGGFYTPVDSKQRIFFQTFIGAGLGKTTINDNGTTQSQDPYSRFYNTNLTKFYLEPSITFRAKEVFAASVATRVSLVKFHNIHTNYSNSEKQDFNLDSLDRFAVVFFEPAFVGSVGFNKLPGFRIEFQAGLSLLWEEDFIDYRPFNFSLGLVFDIPKLIKGPNK